LCLRHQSRQSLQVPQPRQPHRHCLPSPPHQLHQPRRYRNLLPVLREPLVQREPPVPQVLQESSPSPDSTVAR
jgi:hypothetical protein